jgi:hypothetical protein
MTSRSMTRPNNEQCVEAGRAPGQLVDGHREAAQAEARRVFDFAWDLGELFADEIPYRRRQAERETFKALAWERLQKATGNAGHDHDRLLPAQTGVRLGKSVPPAREVAGCGCSELSHRGPVLGRKTR